MSNYDKLIKKLGELFMLDQADLDFGIYRIMNAKRDEINRFLERDLLPQVRQTLSEHQTAEQAQMQQEHDEAVQQAQNLGVDPDSVAKVQGLRQSLAAYDIEALEDEVFSYLHTFFSRYYHEGDFISQRRYKEGTYAIPYEGEEVKLYWANHDQYYIKSSERFRDYTFKLPDERRVHFKLVDAGTEQDNNKAVNGNDRQFILCDETPVVERDGELVLHFEYRPDLEKRKRPTLNEIAVETILAREEVSAWDDALRTLQPTKANANRTLLEKHLDDYTARNSFDYFIHKNLAKFLRRELDFFIKNEVMHLDDIENESAPRVEQYLGKIRALRRIANKIITFLAQIEDFQKKLWVKKKFVIETNYCITLDRVPETLYPEIAANDAQREEWVRLFAIDQIERDLHTPGYSEPLVIDFLHAHPQLPVDTGHFSQRFCEQLCHGLGDAGEIIDGTLIHAENFHALSLVHTAVRQQVKCIY